MRAKQASKSVSVTSVDDAVDGSRPTASQCAKVVVSMNHRETGAIHFEDMDVRGKAVEERAGYRPPADDFFFAPDFAAWPGQEPASMNGGPTPTKTDRIRASVT